MIDNTYEEVRQQLYRLFDLVELIKIQENTIDSFIGEEYYNRQDDEEINFQAIGKRVINFIEKRNQEDISEADLYPIMLSKISDIIKATIELEPNENAEFFDISGDLIDVDKKLEDILFHDEDKASLDEKVNEFVDFQIERLMYSGMNEFVNHDFNIEDWMILDEKKIGYMLDNSIYHHYGCWIPEKFLKHLALPINILDTHELKVQLFYKKKAYEGVIKYQDNKYMIYWEGLLRRRINKKFPHVFSYKDDFISKHRVLMSFYHHENFEDNFIKIDFDVVDI
jgi:hypothetical protein